MKQKIAMLAAALILTCGASFANGTDNNIPNSIQSDFSKHFARAKNVSWQKENEYYKVSFALHGNELFAFYSGDENFIGIAHNILSEKLPMMLQADLKMNYKDYWITDLEEYSINHQSGYIISLENADQKIILKSDNLNKWSVDKKIKKD